MDIKNSILLNQISMHYRLECLKLSAIQCVFYWDWYYGPIFNGWKGVRNQTKLCEHHVPWYCAESVTMLYQVSTKSKYNLVIWQYTITKVFVNIGYDVYGAIVNNLNGMKVYLQIRKVYYIHDNTETYIDRYTYTNSYTSTYIHTCMHTQLLDKYILCCMLNVAVNMRS